MTADPARVPPGRAAAAAVGSGVGLVAATVALTAESAGRWAGPELLEVLILGLVLIPFLNAAFQRRLDLFEPTVILSGIWLFAYVLPAVTIAAGLNPLWNVWGPRAGGDTRTLLTSALALGAAFFGAVLVGYYSLASRFRSVPLPPRVALSVRRMWAWSAAMTAIALVLFAELIRELGGPGVLLSNLNDRVRLFSGLNYLGLPLLSLFSVALLSYAETLQAGRRPTLGLVAVIIFAFGLNTLQGTKTNLFGVLLALVVVRHYLERPVRIVTVVAVALAAVVTAVAYDLFFREYLVSGRVTSLELGGSPFMAVREGWISFSSNTFIHVPVLMLMADGIPTTLPFQLGRPYGALLTMPIPRVFFPDKPPVGTEVFSRAFFGDFLDQGTSIPTTLVGEFYMNFGAPGVVFAGLLMGAGLHLLYRRMLRRRLEPTVVPIYALVVSTLFPWTRGDSFGPTVFFLAVAVPIWLLAWLSSRPPAPIQAAPVIGRRG